MTYQTILDDVSPAGVAANEAALHLPVGLVLLERATAALRSFLAARGLEDYVIFHKHNFDLDDLDRFLPKLDPSAAWQPLPLLSAGAQPLTLTLELNDEQWRLEGVGVIYLPRHQFVLARWHWLDAIYNLRETTALVGAVDQKAYERLHDEVVELRRSGREPVWEIIRSGDDQETCRRKAVPWSDLMLAPAVLSRLQAEVLNFFTPPVAELYGKLNVPYRRGVLMHGPPGNGKTSIIRAIGASMPNIFAMILRPADKLDDNELKSIFRRWRRHAPALLVIEDLDHLLKDYINLSYFLNQIDGIDNSPSGGLMLLATTNHPDRLDPAINNRPGRFDVVIEIPGPDELQRRDFFRGQISDLADATLETLVAQTAGLSFSHLHEVVRLSGLLAINDKATVRTCKHLLAASRLVAESHRNARNGFPVSSDVPFGLAQFRRAASTNSGK